VRSVSKPIPTWHKDKRKVQKTGRKEYGHIQRSRNNKSGSRSCAHTFRDDVEKKDGVVSEYPEIL